MRRSVRWGCMRAVATRTRACGAMPTLFALLLLIGAGPSWCGCLHTFASEAPQLESGLADAGNCHAETGTAGGEDAQRAVSHCPECSGLAGSAEAAPVGKLSLQAWDIQAALVSPANAPFPVLALSDKPAEYRRFALALVNATPVTLHTLMLD